MSRIIDHSFTPYVFVYGTLKQGHHNHKRLLQDAKFVDEGFSTTKGFLGTDTPAFYHEKELLGKDIEVRKIKGEIFKVDLPTFENLDRLEGHPNMYFRCPEVVKSRHFGEYTCWVYFYPGNNVYLENVCNNPNYYEWSPSE